MYTQIVTPSDAPATNIRRLHFSVIILDWWENRSLCQLVGFVAKEYNAEK